VGKGRPARKADLTACLWKSRRLTTRYLADNGQQASALISQPNALTSLWVTLETERKVFHFLSAATQNRALARLQRYKEPFF
jgi:hypothetical protein